MGEQKPVAKNLTTIQRLGLIAAQEEVQRAQAQLNAVREELGLVPGANYTLNGNTLVPVTEGAG